jgi:hypothetical protein
MGSSQGEMQKGAMQKPGAISRPGFPQKFQIALSCLSHVS